MFQIKRLNTFNLLQKYISFQHDGDICWYSKTLFQCMLTVGFPMANKIEYRGKHWAVTVFFTFLSDSLFQLSPGLFPSILSPLRRLLSRTSNWFWWGYGPGDRQALMEKALQFGYYY